MQMRVSSFRAMTSIQLSYGITGSITKRQIDTLGLKIVHCLDFNDFSVIF